MTPKDKTFTLIGIDGGATKVNGWQVDHSPEDHSYSLAEQQAGFAYADLPDHIADYEPVSIQTQLSERESGQYNLTEREKIQGDVYIKTAARTIEKLAHEGGDKPVLIGLGMPGLKTVNLRGINAIANGPRMIDYCDKLEALLKQAGVRLVAPIARMGSDADYCGVGEYYAAEGSLKGAQHVYYLGGGTGAADALLLNGALVPFDHIKPWMAKTWEMKNDLDLSLERYASASGLQFIYARHAGIPVETLNQEKVYPPQIAGLAVKGDAAAVKTYREVANYLSRLIFERISTLYCGSQEIFNFINPNRPVLEKTHPYLGLVYDRIVIGQRLADLMASPDGQQVLTRPLLENISTLIGTADCLPDTIKETYLSGTDFRTDKLVFSKLREAPALGAGIDAHLVYSGATDK